MASFVGPRSFAQIKRIEISKGFQLKVRTAYSDSLKAYVGNNSQKVADMVAGGHKRAIDTIAEKITGGITPLTGGTKAIKYTDYKGNPKRLVTPQAWPELSEDYANRSPKSTTFWVKHHGMTRYRTGKNSSRATLASLFSSARITAVVAKATNIRQKSKTSKYFTFDWDITFATPYSVMSELISWPYAEGLIGNDYWNEWQYNGPISTANASFAVYVEGNRPFMRRMAWKIGKDLRKDILSVLRLGQK